MHPVCKEFIMSPGGVGTYDGIHVVIEKGHNPDLIVGERILDLTQYGTSEQLHALMTELGFSTRTDGLVNRRSECYPWRATGECASNRAFMESECALACATGRDEHKDCARWAAQGECATNAKFMQANCMVSCRATHREEL